MTEQLQTFNFNSSEIRTITKDGQPWFIAKDVAEILEIVNYRDTIASYPKDEKGVATTDTLGGKQKTAIISEAGLYRMIFQSRKESAEKFKTWIFSEVLPTIRKTGSYKLKTSYQEQRDKSKKVRNFFTDTLKDHGISKPHEFINITKSQKKILGIDSPKDEMTEKELILVQMSELLSAYTLTDETGYHSVKPITDQSANNIVYITGNERKELDKMDKVV